MLQWCGGKGTLLHSWWECKLTQPVWKTVQRFLKKLKVITISSSNPIPGDNLEKMKSLIQKDT